MTAVCDGCGSQLGGRRRWCGDACRMRAFHHEFAERNGETQQARHRRLHGRQPEDAAKARDRSARNRALHRSLRPPRAERISQPALVVVPADQRGPLRRAVEDGDRLGVIAIIRSRCDVDEETGCWLWSGPITREGYGRVNVARRVTSPHRVIADATLGPSPEPVHHRCAVRLCCNPQHLERVTNAANAAEMLARNWYITRIDELERALAAVAPQHRALPQLASTA